MDSQHEILASVFSNKSLYVDPCTSLTLKTLAEPALPCGILRSVAVSCGLFGHIPALRTTQALSTAGAESVLFFVLLYGLIEFKAWIIELIVGCVIIYPLDWLIRDHG